MKYYKRGFLNPDEGLAHFAADVRFDIHSNPKYHGIDASFSIADCNRKIELDFCIYDEKEYADKMSKLSLLISELQQFSTEITKAKVLMDVHKAEWAAKEKDRDESE